MSIPLIAHAHCAGELARLTRLSIADLTAAAEKSAKFGGDATKKSEDDATKKSGGDATKKSAHSSDEAAASTFGIQLG